MLTGFMGTAGLGLGSGTSSDMAASVLVSGSPAKPKGERWAGGKQKSCGSHSISLLIQNHTELGLEGTLGAIQHGSLMSQMERLRPGGRGRRTSPRHRANQMPDQDQCPASPAAGALSGVLAAPKRIYASNPGTSPWPC